MMMSNGIHLIEVSNLTSNDREWAKRSLVELSHLPLTERTNPPLQIGSVRLPHVIDDGIASSAG